MAEPAKLRRRLVDLIRKPDQATGPGAPLPDASSTTVRAEVMPPPVTPANVRRADAARIGMNGWHPRLAVVVDRRLRATEPGS
jgi:hypothetical protein